MTVVRDGEVALAAAAGAGVRGTGRRAGARRGAQAGEAADRAREPHAWCIMGIGAVALPAASPRSPPSFLGHFTVFVLAVVIGFYVIGNVTTRCTPR